MTRARPCIVGVGGPRLAPEEAALFARTPPAGVILFARNVEDRAQVRRLVTDLRSACAPWPLLVLVDQEGGRVQRLGPPHWRRLPSAAAIGELARAEPEKGVRAAWLVGRLIAQDLYEVGIDVALAPVLDLALPDTTEAIGDRAFTSDPELVGQLGRAFLAGLEAGGVLGTIKHVPGHGRARTDSHRALPRVATPLDELARTDFHPFRECASAALGMTAHVLFEALDFERPATLSPRVIAEVIRGAIGFHGLLLSDDLEMGALEGPLAARAHAALEAGCDLVLACSGDHARNRALLNALLPMSETLAARLKLLLGRPGPAPGFDESAAALELASLLGQA